MLRISQEKGERKMKQGERDRAAVKTVIKGLLNGVDVCDNKHGGNEGAEGVATFNGEKSEVNLELES
jgi:hypothetical protein